MIKTTRSKIRKILNIIGSFIVIFFGASDENNTGNTPWKEVNEMEVNGLTTLPSTRLPHQVSSSLNHTMGDENMPVTTHRNKINIENTSMDLEEMKDFLFMMIRGGAVRAENDDEKIGRIVNKFA